MRGSSPARARWSEAPNKCLRPGKWPGPSGEVTRRREPGAVFSPGRASQHAWTGERLGERNATSGELGGNECGMVVLCLLRPAIRVRPAGVHAVWL